MQRAVRTRRAELTMAPTNEEEDEEAGWFRVHEQPTLPTIDEVHEAARRSERVVLVVDDNCDNRDLYVELLCQLGFRVLAAHDGVVGLRLAFVTRPDLIVSDISMPNMDGCEMVQRLRMDDRTRNIPVIGVTGFGPAWHEAALASGCDLVLDKPTAPEDFEAAVVAIAVPRSAGA
jgi:two-component system cell cycle response regulator DivK